MDCTLPPRECRVDWLTLTSTDPIKRNEFLDLAAQILNSADQGSTEVKPWRWKGYGGLHRGKITFGRRDDSDIVQLTQDWAWQYLNEFYALATNCTRVDLCVTVHLEEEVGKYIERHSRECLAHRKEKRPSLGTQLIYGNGEAQTLYIGSRTSDLFARIYDKGSESSDPSYECCLRYEIEIKGPPADRCLSTLVAAPDRPTWIRNAVYEYFLKRGIRPLFGGVDAKVSINTIRPVTSDATRLAWLASHVRPTVQRLLATEKPEVLLAALGFPRSISELIRLRKLVERGNHTDPLNDSEDEDEGNADPR